MAAEEIFIGTWKVCSETKQF